MERTRLAFNILAVSGSAIYAGTMLAIGVILGAQWRSVFPSEFLDAFARDIQFISRAVAVTAIPTIVGIAGSLRLNWGHKPAWNFIAAQAACVGLLLLFTSLWFGPTNNLFLAKSLPMNEVAGRLDLWLLLHNIRVALAGLGSVFGALALAVRS